MTSTLIVLCLHYRTVSEQEKQRQYKNQVLTSITLRWHQFPHSIF
ncbi:hypothetical protein J2S19_003015 [Metabacillus malikii]|uniref:YrzI family small protein n=1 Tax=Metabacillus malikii TaxID=1504265 RepID=A0ABT9ZHG5_9BACI|nr:hypothetical protein [Metabacillus malikii]